MNLMPESIELAMLGGGCFWCLDAIYRKIAGIKHVTSGYAGGQTENPTYEKICTGKTGHAEVVKLEFDSNIISFENILEIFWNIHDPTTPNRQGNDIGTQYRSIIFYRNEDQKKIAETSIHEIQLADRFKNPVVTEILPWTDFYFAEEYHQNYYLMNRMSNPYCMAVIDPKIRKFIQEYPDFLKSPDGGY